MYAILVTKESKSNIDFKRGWIKFDHEEGVYYSQHLPDPAMYATLAAVEAVLTDCPNDIEYVIHELLPIGYKGKNNARDIEVS